ncbi:hypothetical protein [Psychrobacter frigidicola]|uniref:AbiTii domain-containing protein n=1 Tax=Psychrobacter frigidicola TaxID=45611 RepID=UPI001919BE95|nr:hypothetical protein [Psychrobacter frigidicola]
MKLVDEIIEVLSSDNGILTEALIKTKVLLHKIGHKELVIWVNKELNGYTESDELPDYRLIPAQVRVSATNGAYTVNSHPIPMHHLDKELRHSLEEARLTYSLAIIERIVVSSKEDILHKPIPMELNGMLGKGLANSYLIQRAWSEIPVASVSNILMQVRSRLLDFILELSSEFSEIDSDKDLKEVVEKFDASNLFNNAIFGDNVTILLGSENTQKVTHSIINNDFESLAKILRENKVTGNDVALLEDAINDDVSFPIVEKDKFGPSVKSWIESMLSKAINASWQIELGVAGSLLATALNSYYGLTT